MTTEDDARAGKIREGRLAAQDERAGFRLDDAEWRERLGEDRYQVLRRQGTEPAFTGEYAHHDEPGVYLCAGCGNPLFRSDDKFDSGSGWPSFTAPADREGIVTREDRSHGMVRTEVRCARCDGHQGHLFDDGPAPTGLRFCINSLSLRFDPADLG